MKAQSASGASAGFSALRRTGDTPLYESFLALSEKHRKEVVLHVIRAPAVSDPAVLRRFIEVAERTISLEHPNLLRPLEVGRLPDGRWFLATEQGPGEQLEAVVRKAGLLEADLVAQLGTSLCDGLGHLHQAGLFHGDVRPQNVLLNSTLAVLRPKLSGLALSELRRDTGEGEGYEYVAPECLAGGPRTVRSDLYSLGATLYTCAAGHPPFARNRVTDAGPPPLPPQSSHLTTVINRCLEKDPEKRFASTSEMSLWITRSSATMVSSIKPAVVGGGPAGAVIEGEGDTLGSYELVKLLGEGTMGRVFLARHTRLGRQVAIKILRPEFRNDELIPRFFQEARTVNQINHEHIVEIIDFVQEMGPEGTASVYFVMELLNGGTLGQLISSHVPIPLVRSVGIVRQMCEALAAAHKIGVVHRDVKPDNIFITQRGGLVDYVKVLDFGVAKLTKPELDTALVSTADGAIIGTPACMAPEQVEGKDVDPRTDVYAAGVCLYELLADRLPFEGKTFGALAAQIITQPPPPLPERTLAGEKIPPRLEEVVRKCLEKDPAKRWQTMLELHEALAPFAVAAARPSGGKRGWMIAAGLAVGGVVAAGVIMLQPVAPLQVVPPPPLPEPVKVVTPPPVEPPPDPPEVVEPPPVVPDVKPPPPKPPPERPPGPLKVTEITTTIARSQGKIQKCFERYRTQLGANAATGSVTIVLGIEPGGNVTLAQVTGQEGTPLADCIVTQAKVLKFPKHTGGPVKINVPFAYRVE